MTIEFGATLSVRMTNALMTVVVIRIVLDLNRCPSLLFLRMLLSKIQQKNLGSCDIRIRGCRVRSANAT